MTSPPPSRPTPMLDEIGQAIRTGLACEVVACALLESEGLLRVLSVSGDDRFTPLLGMLVPVENWDGATALGSSQVEVLGVPLLAADGELLGMLGTGWAERSTPDAASRRALEAYAVPVARLVEQARGRMLAEASQAELLNQAMTDPLTTVGNRTLLLERLRHATTARTRSESVMALAFVDLDNFKAVNDAHSHAVGDQALRTVARRIQAAVRAHDTVSRWGGDEFLVLLHPVLDEHAALGVVQRILAAVAEPVTAAGVSVQLSASVGVAFGSPGADVDAEELVRRADAAMYDAKAAGRDRFAVFDAQDPAVSRRLHLRELLERASADDRLVVHYQPIVRVDDGCVTGVEALLRLRDDDGSLVYPSELLHRGAVPTDIARSALRTACRDVAGWVDDGHDLQLAVNVSAQQVTDIESFCLDIEQAVTDAGLAPQRLVLELTEHTLMSTTPHIVTGLQQLVDRGIGLSIDDFGTGYGSLTYVRVMPVHELKVDRSFVQEARHQPAATAVVRSIASLAQELGLRCVAEGVEDAEQHEFLRSVGVSLAQGSFYADPQDAAAISRLLAAASPGGGRAAADHQ